MRAATNPAQSSNLFAPRGAGLTARQLRFWQIILDLPRRQVDGWLAAPGRKIWDQRCYPFARYHPRCCRSHTICAV